MKEIPSLIKNLKNFIEQSRGKALIGRTAGFAIDPATGTYLYSETKPYFLQWHTRLAVEHYHAYAYRYY
jgi:hypothetical protein